MAEPDRDHRPQHEKNPSGPFPDTWLNRRREKIYQEIQANRRGEYRLPTWMLALLLVLIIAAIAAFVIFTSPGGQ